MTKKTKTPRIGRPVENVIKPINDTAENVAKSIMMGKPKKKWDYEKAS